MRTAPRLVMGLLRPSGFEWTATNLALPYGFTYTRTGTRPYLDSTGIWRSASANSPRFDFQPTQPGLLMADARNNKVTAIKSNPSATTNCTTSGDGSGVLSVVDGTIALGSAFALFGPNVYKVDNSAGATAFYVRFGGTTGGTSAHSLSCIAYGAGDMLLYDGTTETGAVAIDGASFARFIGNNVTPANSSQQFAVKCAAGEIAYIVVPQMEQAAFADRTPIPGANNAVTLNADVCSRSIAVPTVGMTAIWDVILPPVVASGAGYTLGEFAIDASNRCVLYMDGGSQKIAVFYTTSGVTQASFAFGSVSTLSARHRVALRVESNNIGLCVDGGTVVKDASCTIWSGSATEYLAQNRSSSDFLFGHILASPASPTEFRLPASDAGLQALSTL